MELTFTEIMDARESEIGGAWKIRLGYEFRGFIVLDDGQYFWTRDDMEYAYASLEEAKGFIRSFLQGVGKEVI